MKINKELFLEGLKNQFEDSDANKLNFESKFTQLETWDSLTRFSIIAFAEDDYNVIITPEQLNSFETPNDLYLFIENNI
ncbi:MAG TPA: acyl carrier protein [Flavobacterium sp.]|jgi:acyl carrier protein